MYSLCVIYRFEVVKNTGADTPHDAELLGLLTPPQICPWNSRRRHCSHGQGSLLSPGPLALAMSDAPGLDTVVSKVSLSNAASHQENQWRGRACGGFFRSLLRTPHPSSCLRSHRLEAGPPLPLPDVCREQELTGYHNRTADEYNHFTRKTTHWKFSKRSRHIKTNEPRILNWPNTYLERDKEEISTVRPK